MRTPLIASFLAGAAFATSALAQDAGQPDGMTGAPEATTPIPQTDDTVPVDPMADPMSDPAPDTMPEPMTVPMADDERDSEVVAEIDAMAQGDLSADQQAQYAAWPAGTQSYYDGLTPDRQELFWMLRDTDNVALSQLPEAQQTEAWTMIEQQASGATAPPATTSDEPSE